MTLEEEDRIVTFGSIAIIVILSIVMVVAMIADIDDDKSKSEPKIVRKVVTVYCLGNKSTPVYCKTVKEEYEDLTDNEYKGKYYE